MADVVVPMEYLEAYARTLKDLDEISRSLLVDSLANVDLNDRKAVTATVKAVCRTSGEAATQLSAQFYRGMSVLQTGYDPKAYVHYTFDPNATSGAVRRILEQYEDEDEILSQLTEHVSYETNRAAKVGVWRAGQADKKQYAGGGGREVRYARVPMGAETCAWCIMTSGLGFHYMSEEAASHTHAHCDCMIVPSIGRGDVTIDGYDSTVGRDMWRDAAKRLRSGDVPTELRQRIQTAKERHASRTDKKWKPVNEELIAMRYFNGLEH